MAKDNKAAPVTGEGQIKLSLTEFCKRLSETVKRPELIGGFEASERLAGNRQDTEDAFRSRFETFINKPV